MEKPDFKNIASHKSDIQDHDTFLGFVAGCEHVWDTHVVPLQEKLKVSDHLKELDDDAIVTLQKENKELREEVDRLKDDNEALFRRWII